MDTTEKPDEGNQQTASEGLPNPTFADGGGQPSTTSIEELKKQVEDLQKQLRGVQGDKDRAVKRTELKVDDLNQQIARILELKESGKDESSIRRELLLDKILESGVIPVQEAGGTVKSEAVPSDAQFNVVEVLNRYGLSTNEPEVIALAKGRYRNADHFEAEAAKLAFAKLKPATPSASTSAPMTGGSLPGQMTDSEREAKSAKLLQLYKTPTLKANEIKVLEKELGI